MEKEKKYIIYTDASFDDKTKIGTYAIVIMQENAIIKTISRRCNIQMNNSIECEVFAVYQAINIILNSYIKKDKMQKFKIRTDCEAARDFFIGKNIKIFKNKKEFSNIMKKNYKKLCSKLSKTGCSFTINWVPREKNKDAHNNSYAMFRRLKIINEKNNILVIEQKSFIKILENCNKNQCKIILYLLNNTNQQKLISMTQKQIAEALNVHVSTINKVFKELMELNIIEKLEKGCYGLLI